MFLHLQVEYGAAPLCVLVYVDFEAPFVGW